MRYVASRAGMVRIRLIVAEATATGMIRLARTTHLPFSERYGGAESQPNLLRKMR